MADENFETRQGDDAPASLPRNLASSLCADCRHRRTIVSGKGAVFLMCEVGLSQDSWPKYPPQPMYQCQHFEKPTEDAKEAEEAGPESAQAGSSKDQSAAAVSAPNSDSVLPQLPVLDSAVQDEANPPTRQHLLDLTTAELTEWLTERKYPKFRTKQILAWVYQNRAESFEDMSDLPKRLRSQLAEAFDLWTANIKAHQTSEDGTEKLLVDLAAGGHVECVLLRDGDRRSICVSSQVGCAMGCVFCASGLDGVDRNLTRGEVLEQMLRLQRLLPEDERLSHIVMMGMGEPLANLDSVLAALEVARHPEGLGISPRRITISTVGLPKAIDRLAKHSTPFHLAISLHAPNDALRDRLVPVNAKIGIKDILSAADRYFEATGRRLTFEYVLLAGLNDSEKCARELVQLLRGRISMLNVIPYNPVEGLPYETPTPETVHDFRNTLMEGGINVMFRQRKGSGIDAACGQLRRNRQEA